MMIEVRIAVISGNIKWGRSKRNFQGNGTILYLIDTRYIYSVHVHQAIHLKFVHIQYVVSYT